MNRIDINGHLVPTTADEIAQPGNAAISIPSQVELYQFAGQAVAEDIIPDADAKAWLGQGAIPGKLQTALDKLLSDKEIDQERHDKAVYFLMGSKQIPRNHPLTSMLGAILGKDTAAKLDQFFIDAENR
jgi:hypothetical protein